MAQKRVWEQLRHKELRSRRWGPLRQEWYSVCSAHYWWRTGCPACQSGQWINIWVHALDHQIHQRHYGLWHWWHNRPRSRSRRFLRSIFPNFP